MPTPPQQPQASYEKLKEQRSTLQRRLDQLPTDGDETRVDVQRQVLGARIKTITDDPVFIAGQTAEREEEEAAARQKEIDVTYLQAITEILDKLKYNLADINLEETHAALRAVRNSINELYQKLQDERIMYLATSWREHVKPDLQKAFPKEMAASVPSYRGGNFCQNLASCTSEIDAAAAMLRKLSWWRRRKDIARICMDMPEDALVLEVKQLQSQLRANLDELRRLSSQEIPRKLTAIDTACETAYSRTRDLPRNNVSDAAQNTARNDMQGMRGKLVDTQALFVTCNAATAKEVGDSHTFSNYNPPNGLISMVRMAGGTAEVDNYPRH